MPLLLWLAGAAALATAVLVAVPRPGPLDDPDPAHERTGILSSPRSARNVGLQTLPGDKVGRRTIFLVFDRRLPEPARLARLERQLPREVEVAVVVPRVAARSHAFPAAVIRDSRRRVARAVGMRRPKDGGPPVGYALIDGKGRVRYATLDPAYLDHGSEAATMAAAVG